MRRLVYDVAVSLDGFISGPNNDASGFLMQGSHVDAYFERLQGYTSVVMGRGTYEAGLAWGLKPGVNPYPHMQAFVFSEVVEMPAGSPITVVREEAAEFIADLKTHGTGDIYLCGGGMFAGEMLRAGLIDQVILKLNPVVIGAGAPLFGADRFDQPTRLRLVSTYTYDTGVMLLTYEP